MKFSLVSDVHLEFHGCEIKNTDNSDVLIIAGDLCVADYLKRYPLKANYDSNYASEKSNVVERFFDSVSAQWKHVLYTPGNHEYYKGEIDTADTILRAEVFKYPNIHFLQQKAIYIEDVKFLGATLWTNVNRGDPLTEWTLRQSMNDYRLIRNSHSYTKITPAQTAQEFAKAVKFLEKEVNENCVVFTHHAPSFLSIHPRYSEDKQMNGGYASDLSEFILSHPGIRFWCHGHIHDKADYEIGNTRVVANPRGYYGAETKEIEFGVKTYEII